jgi:hypothetical protein
VRTVVLGERGEGNLAVGCCLRVPTRRIRDVCVTRLEALEVVVAGPRYMSARGLASKHQRNADMTKRQPISSSSCQHICAAEYDEFAFVHARMQNSE